MRIPILILMACCLAGCAANQSPPPLSATDAANGVPDPAARLTPAQIAQLRSRLDQLRVGMSRAKVLEILNLSSFNVPSIAYANQSGIRYKIEHDHNLELGMKAGDYDYTLRWAKFDGEVWPQNWAPKDKAPATSP